MDAATAARIIQTIIVPVVMVTACAILVTGLLSRYAAVNDRLRLMVRERLDLLQSLETDATPGEVARTFAIERLNQIDGQVPDLLRRHRLIRNAVLMEYWAILVFVLCMFTIAVAESFNVVGVATASLLVFLIGTAIMLLGVLLTALEVRVSHRALRYEVERVMRLNRSA